MKPILVILCVVLAASACSDENAELAAELVNDQPTEQTRKGWEGDLFPDAQTFTLMRAAAARRRGELLAFAFLRTGVHPYSAFSFTQLDGEVTVVETAMYWGTVQGKWVSRVPRETVDQFLVAASEILDCSEASRNTDGFGGAALIHGEADCRGEIFSEESAAFDEALVPLFEGSTRTYEPSDGPGNETQVSD